MESRSLTLVFKIGSSSLTHSTQGLNRAYMVDIARQCALLHQEGHRIILVSSGAIAAGSETLDFPLEDSTIPMKDNSSIAMFEVQASWNHNFATTT